MGAGEKQSIAPAGIEIRHLRGLEEFHACLEMEKLVWGVEDIDVVPLPIFVIAAKSGGQVIGAFDTAEVSRRMIGFTLALAGFHEGGALLHSHMTAVLPEYQNRGVGRRLKLTQRQDALSRGIELVEWTFDPLELRNAYFNLVRLGAIVRRFLPNCYGVTTSPLHGRLPTDRLLAEWWLNSLRVKAIVAGQTIRPAAAEGKDVARILVPANIVELKTNDRAEAARVQGRIREQFQEWFRRGYAVTGIERSAEGGSYLLEPFEPPHETRD